MNISKRTIEFTGFNISRWIVSDETGRELFICKTMGKAARAAGWFN